VDTTRHNVGDVSLAGWANRSLVVALVLAAATVALGSEDPEKIERRWKRAMSPERYMSNLETLVRRPMADRAMAAVAPTGPWQSRGREISIPETVGSRESRSY
jgi:hypothetical protein